MCQPGMISAFPHAAVMFFGYTIMDVLNATFLFLFLPDSREQGLVIRVLTITILEERSS